MSRTDWFTEARFGMFIHWGLYAIPAAGEWVFAHRDWKDGEYQSLMQQFNPEDYDPAQWAALAKAAGMKYVVFTTKHHDGFCMFDSKYTDYKITNTPYGKDTTRMLVEAFRQAGLKVGFYHSLPDWTHPGYADEESPEFIQHKILHTPAPDLPEVWHSEWLVLDGSLHDTAAIGETLSQTGRVPEELKAKVVSFDTPYMDLSPYGNNVGCLHLFSFLEVSNGETPRNELVFMAAADVGIRVWMDGVRILNHHSRQKMIPAFHRTEGGSSFHLPVECGSRHLFHVELFNCTVPVKCCIMFGNTNNDLLDGFDFRIPAGHGVQ